MRATWHGPARSHPAPSASVPAHPRPGGAREPHLGPFLSRATPPRFSVRRRSVRDTCRPTHQRCTERCIPLRCMRAGKSETSGQQIHLGGPVNYPPVPPAGTHAGRQQRDGVVAVVGRLNHPLEEPREQPRGVRGLHQIDVPGSTKSDQRTKVASLRLSTGFVGPSQLPGTSVDSAHAAASNPRSYTDTRSLISGGVHHCDQSGPACRRCSRRRRRAHIACRQRCPQYSRGRPVSACASGSRHPTHTRRRPTFAASFRRRAHRRNTPDRNPIRDPTVTGLVRRKRLGPAAHMAGNALGPAMRPRPAPCGLSLGATAAAPGNGVRASRGRGRGPTVW